MAQSGYDMYFDKCLFPVTPEKISIKINVGQPGFFQDIDFTFIYQVDRFVITIDFDTDFFRGDRKKAFVKIHIISASCHLFMHPFRHIVYRFID